jgi:hypothetical protein
MVMRNLINVGNKVADRWDLELGEGVVTKVTASRTMVRFKARMRSYETRQLMYLRKVITGGR